MYLGRWTGLVSGLFLSSCHGSGLFQSVFDTVLCRCFYLMATNFAEKQHWVALLEAVASSNKNSNKITDASVFGNVICRMSSRDSQRMDFMCTWPLSDDVCTFT